MPDCLEMPYKPAIVGAHEPAEGEKRWRMGGTSCLAGDYYGDWPFDHELKVGRKRREQEQSGIYGGKRG